VPRSFYPYRNKYREVIDFGSKMHADNCMRAGWERIDTHAATFEARRNTPINRLVDMFGWNSPAMTFRSQKADAIAHEGLFLEE
jgi:hypothetical protein